MSDIKLVIKSSDMDEKDLKYLTEVAIAAFKEPVKDNKQEKIVAKYIKHEFDKQWGWNCVVGRNFGAEISHRSKNYVFFQIKQLSIMLWKS